MIRTLIAGLALGACLLPLTASADDDMVASEGSFELWASSVGEEKGWAVINTADDKAVYAGKKDGKVSIKTGEAAEASIADMRTDMPDHNIVWTDRNTNLTFTSSEGKKVRIIELDGDDVDMDIEIDGEDIDLEEILAKSGLDIDADLEFEDEDGVKRNIVIRTTKGDDVTVVTSDAEGASATVTVDGDVTIETDEDGKTEKRVKVISMPNPPAPPHPAEVTVIDTGDGKTVVSTGTRKIVHEYESDEDGRVSMSFTHMTGVSAEDAVEFIEDIDDLNDSEKGQMKAALSL